ncbi:hypothetical protein [Fervidobacterium thailandense]|uniref:Uncharacterized protein n=1 Tax=Fervidobacterium thailandense TaxID=1008305 RepID=A0A1E3G2J7_9BACT|nr:hypothetical protein [Fervidobacterium thailandense]ODN29878.1 hypothetical protein A4H02_08415 [Fervidobacterium thailandense]
MTLARVKPREAVVERQQERSFGFLAYLIPVALLGLLTFASIFLSAKAAKLESAVLEMRRSLEVLKEQSEVLNQKIVKLTVGRDLVN